MMGMLQMQLLEKKVALMAREKEIPAREKEIPAPNGGNFQVMRKVMEKKGFAMEMGHQHEAQEGEVRISSKCPQYKDNIHLAS